MSTAKKVALVLVVLVSCVGCDQATKGIARNVLVENEAHSYFADTIRVQLTHNEGGFLSLGASLPEPWRQILLTGGVFVLLGILCYAMLSKQSNAVTVLALALIFGGGASNLLDRLLYGGRVTDFLNVGIGSLRTGIFNVADIDITLGALILMANELLSKGGSHGRSTRERQETL